jgi:hypothetical protein
VLRRWVGGGILGLSFGERPSTGVTEEGDPPERSVARDSIGFVEE